MDIRWWGWVLIWTGLVVLLLVVLALGAWLLFRKGMRVLDELGELADSTGVLEADDPVLPRRQLAVLAEARDIRLRENARRAHRRERRRVRIAARLARARRITTADPAWPEAWERRNP